MRHLSSQVNQGLVLWSVNSLCTLLARTHIYRIVFEQECVSDCTQGLQTRTYTNYGHKQSADEHMISLCSQNCSKSCTVE